MGGRPSRGPPCGAGAARNTGWRAASGTWIAFTDADCVPARTWLAALLAAVDGAGADPPALGAAGRTHGLESKTDVARYVDLSGALDAARHLAHPTFPFAPSGNVMYRRAALEAYGGFDERYTTYEACELHGRLRANDPGAFVFAPRAIVLHRHRPTWRPNWKQQAGYGVGGAQCGRHHRGRGRWAVLEEGRAGWDVARSGVRALLARNSRERLFARGTFVKRLAQRSGFDATYWNATERARW